MKYKIIERIKLNGEKQYCPQVVKCVKVLFSKKEKIYNLCESTTGSRIDEEFNTKYWYNTIDEALDIINRHKNRFEIDRQNNVILEKIIEL